MGSAKRLGMRDAALKAANDILSSVDMRLERASKRRTLVDFLKSRNVTTVYDIGANQGQFGQAITQDGYKGRIISFEPVRSAFNILLRNAAERGDWEVTNIGLSDQVGKAEINVSKYTVFSSLNNITAAAIEFHPEAAYVAKETIDLDTLNNVFREVTGNNFLKIDTQGHEQSIIAGASDVLQNFCGVQMELPIKHLYDNTWTIEAAISMMRKHGFVLSNIFSNNFDTKQDPVSLLEVDCIFKRLGNI